MLQVGGHGHPEPADIRDIFHWMNVLSTTGSGENLDDPRLRYAYSRDHGMFIGSGAVEAGCKAVIGHNAVPTVMRHRDWAGLISAGALPRTFRTTFTVDQPISRFGSFNGTVNLSQPNWPM